MKRSFRPRPSCRTTVFVAVAFLWGAPSPANAQPAAASKAIRLEEAKALGESAEKLQRRGRLEEAALAVEKKLAIERELAGREPDVLVASLERLALLQIEREDFTAARKAMREVLAIQTDRPDALAWKQTDARLDLDHIDRLAKLKPEQRRRLVAAKEFMRKSIKFGEFDRYREAIAYAEKAVEIRKEFLGEAAGSAVSSLAHLGWLHALTGDPKTAARLLTRVAELRKQVPGEGHPRHANALEELAVLYAAGADYARGEALYLQATAIYKKTRHPNHARCAGRLAELYGKMARRQEAAENFAEARRARAQILALRKELHGDKHWQVREARLELARLERVTALDADQRRRLRDSARVLGEAGESHRAGKYAEAIALAEKVLETRRELLGKEALEVATALNYMASPHRAQGDYARAEALFREASAIYKDALGEDHPDHVESLERLSDLYDTISKRLQARGDFPGAREAVRKALAIERKLHKEGHWAVTNARLTFAHLDRLAMLDPEQRRRLAKSDALSGEVNRLVAQGKPGEGLATSRAAMALHREVLGEENRGYAALVNNLGWLHEQLGEYAEAEPHYRHALAIRKRVQGAEHPDYAGALNNLGSLLMKLGDYPGAEPLLREAVRIRKQTLGEDDADYALTLNNLGMLYLMVGEHHEAEPLLRQALVARRNSAGERDAAYARGLNNLGGLYQRQGDDDLAEPLYRQAATIWEAAGERVEYARSLDNLANLARLRGDFKGAEGDYRRAKAIFAEVLGKQHPDYAINRSNQAILYGALGRWDDAAEATDDASRTFRLHVSRVLPGLSEPEQLRFLRTQYERGFHGSLSLGLARPGDASLAERSAAWILNGKAVAQQALAENALLARDSAKPEVRKLVARLRAVRAELALVTNQPARPGQEDARRERLAELGKQERALAKTVGLEVGRPVRDDPWVQLAEVRKALAADAVLIEIARFRVWDFAGEGKAWRPPHYAAWVIPAAGKGAVRVLDLGDAEKIDEAVWQVRRALETASRSIAEHGEAEAERKLRRPLEELAALVLRPLLPHIADKGQWLIGPDADLWLVPWAALPLPDGKYAVERHRISYLVSGRDLVEPAADGKPGPPLVLADPDYDLGVKEAAVQTQQLLGKDPVGLVKRSGGLGGARWRRLPGTADEAKAIAPSLEAFAGVKPRVYTGKQALEGLVKAARGPRVLVLSTHGFFLEDQDDVAPPLAMGSRSDGRDLEWLAPRRPAPRRPKSGRPLENPLLRCGLALAGANHRDEATAGADDGVLTGLEVVGLDLRGTELVVLSACETGLGHVRNGEGVAGLRQAFQLAGARAVAASLWKVPDRETAQLMAAFFSHLAKRRPRADALRAAQREMIDARRRGDGKAAHPFYWAAFTLTGL